MEQETQLTNNETPSIKNEGKKKSKSIFIIIGVILALLIGGGIFFFTKKPTAENSSFDIYFVLSPELNIVEKDKNSETDTFSVVEKTYYGTAYALGSTIEVNDKKYMKIVPFAEGSQYTLKEEFKGKEYYLEVRNECDIVSEYEFTERYKPFFTNKETQFFPSYIKMGILDYIASDEANSALVFTQNPDRIKHVIAYGDFDTDGKKDVAVILESKNGGSKILILCYNKDSKKAYIAYDSYTDLDKPLINSFKKGASIFMNSDALVKSPNNGIIINYPAMSTQKTAILYNPQTKQFETFIQRSKTELEEGYDGEHDVYETEAAVAVEEY